MDKILITSFRDEIANAILNAQEKLNPVKDAYIDETELQGVLDFFGVKPEDLPKLLKSTDNQSVFENNENSSSQQISEDVLQLSAELSENDALTTYGTAANELDSKTKANLALNSAGISFAQHLDALEREKNLRMLKNEDVTDVIYKIETLNELVKNYMKEHPEADKKHLIVKEISYGKNGDKKAIISQSFGINGNNGFSSNSTTSSDADSSEQTADSQKGNSTSAEVNCNIDFRTMNSKYKGNWHIKGMINAGSDNRDFHGAFQYTKVFKNDGVLNFTGNVRESIINDKATNEKSNIGSFGASVDYKKNKFSTGAYYMSSHDNESSQKNYEVYGKYSKSLIASIGNKTEDGIKYYYAKGLAQGKRKFENSGLSVNGGIGCEYGFYDVGVEDYSQNVFKVRAKGGIAFKSKDFSADLSADISRNRISTNYMGNSVVTKTSSVAVVGNLSTKNIDVSATVTSVKVDPGRIGEGMRPISDKPSITGSILFGIKNYFGKNIMPILRYNIGNYDGANQSIGAGVILSL